MSTLLEGLNEQQKDAVMNLTGPSLVIAGAGSGKTRVLTYRIAQLLATGVYSYKILSLTFTNKAAAEMKERISAMVGADVTKQLWMGTFHSIFSKILRYESDKIGFSSNYTIYDSQDTKNLIKKVIKDLNLDADKYKPGEVYSAISQAKNNLITADNYINNSYLQDRDRNNGKAAIGTIYKNYTNRCKRADAMDFDDLLLYTNILFREHPEILSKYQDKFQYILVDEYQDTNYSQYLIVKKLSELHKNICVVGDDAQSIYSFRGAKIENILNFKNDYPNYNIYKLEQNYRSTQTIVDAANSLIKKNLKQIPKNTFSKNDPGEKIRIIKTMTDSEEGYMLANIISKATEKESNYSDYAILYRTNAQSMIFEEALNRLHIPCKIYGGISFFQRKEIKDLLSYFRLAINLKDEEALDRVINYPGRGIGRTTVDKMFQLAQHSNISTWDILANIEQGVSLFNKGTISKIAKFRELILSFHNDIATADAYSLAHRIATNTGMLKMLEDDNSIEGKSRLENIQELLNGVKEFTENESEILLPSYMEKIALLTDINEEDTESFNRVTLMTIHSAKGLEFKHCFIVGMEENLFPSMMSLNSEKNIEEERRLFYVALTRAEVTATLSYASSRRKWGKLNSNRPSRFLNEIDTQYLTNNSSNDFDNQDSHSTDSFTPVSSTINSFRSKQQSNSSFSKFKPKKSEDFIADPPERFQSGMQVEHDAFGIGKILQIEGNMPNTKATIFFENAGQKKLLLKFAKLRIVQ